MSETDPDDLVAGLLSAPDEAWAELHQAVAELGPDGMTGTWRGGEPLPINENVIEMPWVEFSPAFERVVVALYGVNAVAPFDWMAWTEENGFPDGSGLQDASIDDVVRTITAVVRSDRFCEGSLKEAVDSGTFAVLVERLRAWDAHRRA